MMRAAGTAHTKTAARDEQVLLEFCEAGGADSVDSYARDQLRQGLAPRTVANKLITVQRYLHVLLDEDSSQAAAAGTIARRLVTVAAHIDHLNHVPAALNAQGAFVPASGEERVQAQLEYALQDALYSMCLLPSDHSIQQQWLQPLYHLRRAFHQSSRLCIYIWLLRSLLRPPLSYKTWLLRSQPYPCSANFNTPLLHAFLFKVLKKAADLA